MGRSCCPWPWDWTGFVRKNVPFVPDWTCISGRPTSHWTFTGSRYPVHSLRSQRCQCSSTIERQFVRTERPLYGHLVTLLEGAIARGELPSGARVPPERTLAQQLRISRTTVVSAYRELESRGLLRGYVGRGTFVCAAPEPEGTPFAWRGKIAAAALRSSDSTLRDLVRNSSDARLVSLAAGEPAIDKFPNEAFQEAVATCCRPIRRRHGGTVRRKASRRCAKRSPIATTWRATAC